MKASSSLVNFTGDLAVSRTLDNKPPCLVFLYQTHAQQLREEVKKPGEPMHSGVLDGFDGRQLRLLHHT